MISFRPLISGSHLQTIGGQFVRSFLEWPFATEDSVVAAEDDVRLLVRASWQPGGAGPALLLIHGLEGSDEARYMLSTGILAFRAGYHVIRMNMRGCGDSLELCPRLYDAGLTTDLVAVFNWLARRVPRFAVGGFSLGAGLTLLTLAREKQSLPAACIGAVAVCPPLDMSRCADALELRKNWIYQFRFTRSLCRSYRSRQRLSPERHEQGRERGITSLRQFDDVVTAHYGGYSDAEDYYRTVSAGPRLEEIDRPTLVLGTDNDPFIPYESIAHWPHSENVRVEIVEGAGHVGFLAASNAPRYFWAADRMLAFLQAIDSL
ncbi:MAG: alpha/beta fold hydrolase [Acidobacteriota bacterium]|nr:MAG: alpha/beta fold hydrolase [Acidobacteriota bacterium]